MRKVISNTTPIISLLKIGKLNLLKDLYEKIIIPNAVFQEIENGKHKEYYQDISKIDWIDIQNISNKESVLYLFDLDEGEAEVLILAHELNADLVIIDELAGRRYAKNLDLKLTGTIGILLRAKELALISNVKNCLDELIEKGSWIDNDLVNKVLKLANE
jgi:predicted nucleic acid-binding protein